MAKQTVNIGTSANKGNGDPLRTAFTKINNNFDEIYSALGSDGDLFDPSSVDQSLVPTTTNTVDLGTASKQWRSLYVSNNTIYIGGVAIGVDANGNLTTGGTVVGSTPAWNSITGKPTFATVATTGAYGDLSGLPTDLKGSVFSDDSTLMIDAVNNKIYATELTVAVGNFVNVNSNNVDVENINGLSSQINFTVGGYNNLVIENNLVTIQNVSLSVAGDITLGGDIRSESAINIDINLTDSTQRIWRFGEDGDLAFPDGTVQTTAFAGNAATVDIMNTNGIDYNYSITFVENRSATQDLRADVDLTFNSATNTLTAANFLGNLTGVADIAKNIESENAVEIRVNLTDSTLRRWRFGEDGDLTFPDGTNQSTAWTGYTTTLETTHTVNLASAPSASGDGSVITLADNTATTKILLNNSLGVLGRATLPTLTTWGKIVIMCSQSTFATNVDFRLSDNSYVNLTTVIPTNSSFGFNPEAGIRIAMSMAQFGWKLI